MINTMTASTRIYAGGAVAFGGQPAIDDLTAAQYSAVVVWSVHVEPDAGLVLNDTPFVSGGVYKEAQPMGLPARLAQLRKAGIEIVFSVGAGGTSDFTNIGNLLASGSGKQALYDNFDALRQAMVDAGGDIDAVDFDNEDNMDTGVMVAFGQMLGKIGYAHVTLCPYYQSSVWANTFAELNADPGVGFVNAIHLQCYSGGSGNIGSKVVESWQDMIAAKGAAGKCLLVPGLATNQAQPGPWWYEGAAGGSVVKTQGTAMAAGADWSKHLRTENHPTADAALQGAQSWGGATFFFYCNAPVNLGHGKQFDKGDAVFFAGIPQWESEAQCDAYSLSGGCSNIYNPIGACPADLQAQYKTWKGIKTPPQGGFIWLYDSVLDCLLSGCCGGSEQNPATTAKAYRDAIVAGLS
jgi:hypothetical protein